MVDAHLGVIGVWLAFVASIAGALVVVAGLVAEARADRVLGGRRARPAGR